MSLGRSSAVLGVKGNARGTRSSTLRAPKSSKNYLCPTKASMARRQSQSSTGLNEATFVPPQQDNSGTSSESSSITLGLGVAVSHLNLEHQFSYGYCHTDTAWEIEQFYAQATIHEDAAAPSPIEALLSEWDDCDVHVCSVRATEQLPDQDFTFETYTGFSWISSVNTCMSEWANGYRYIETPWEIEQFYVKVTHEDDATSWGATHDDATHDDATHDDATPNDATPEDAAHSADATSANAAYSDDAISWITTHSDDANPWDATSSDDGDSCHQESWSSSVSTFQAEWDDGYVHVDAQWEMEQFHAKLADPSWDTTPEDTWWEIRQFHIQTADEDDATHSYVDSDVDSWSSDNESDPATDEDDAFLSLPQTPPTPHEDSSEGTWDPNYVHRDSAWEFMQFGTTLFMTGRKMSDDPNAEWDAPLEDPIDEDVALRQRLDHEENDHDETCDCTNLQQSREFANDGCGLVYLGCHDGSSDTARVCNDCGDESCECDDDETALAPGALAGDKRSVYTSGNIDSEEHRSSKWHLDELIAETDKLAAEIDQLTRQKLRYARDAARYSNIGQRLRSQVERSKAELNNCEFRLIKSQGANARFRQAAIQLALMLHKYRAMGITDDDNDILGQVRYIIGGLVDFVPPRGEKE